MIHVVLAGGYDTQNLGDHAMLVVLREELERRYGGVRITLLSRHPDPEFDRTYGVRSIQNLDHTSRAASRGKWFHGLNGEVDTAHLGAIAEAIGKADLLVIGGGRMLVDYTHGFLRGHLAYFAQLTVLARFLGTPMMLYAHSLEPLATVSGEEHLRFLAQNASAISVREEASREVLADLGVPAEWVAVLPDPAFALRLEPPYLGPKLPALPRDGRPLLAVNVRSYAWRDGDVAAFEEHFAFLLDRIVIETQTRLLFVPQMTYGVDSAETDDRAVARRIAGRMRRANEALFIEDPLSVPEALGCYGHATALLSMRRHGMLFAASQGVPVMPFSVERNTDYIAQALGVENLAVALADEDAAVATVRKVLAAGPELGPAILQRTAQVASFVSGYGAMIEEVVAPEPRLERRA